MRWMVTLGCGWAIFMSVAAAGDEPIVLTYDFERPHVQDVRLGSDNFQRVVLPDCGNTGRAGEPALPSSGARILIPFGSEVTNVTVVPGQTVSLGQGYRIEPLLPPYPLMFPPTEPPLAVPNATIYTQNAPFPGAAFERIGISGFRGYEILVLKLHPVQYVPATGELLYYPRLIVTVETAETGRFNPLYRGTVADQVQALRKVDNPQTARSYAASGLRTDRAYDLLIITTPALASSFQPLKAWHDAHGLATEIRTTTDVGGSSADLVRTYVTNRYTADGIQYVLIGGDDDALPAKDLYVLAYSGGDEETAMPGDLYVGCLDGTWNYDGDGYSGEPTDGPGGGDVDLIAEVCVGRAAVDSPAEATRFVNKTLFYLNNQHTKPANVLMLGEYLGFGGISDYAGPMMDQCVDGSSADGYTTVGIPSDRFTIARLYDENGEWTASQWASYVNSGQHILNHLGHGNTDYAMKTYNSDVLSLLTNTDLCFIYSQTCLAGHFDGTECWAETITIKTNYGAFAAVMNARYGWGSGYSTDGPSQRFNREFWDAVFNPDENLTEIGPANHDSKEDNLYRIGDDCMRWCYYETNLFGDPTIRIRGALPELQILLPNGVPTLIPPGTPTTITVDIRDGEEAYVAGTGKMFYRLSGGSYQQVALQHTSGTLYLATLPSAACGDTPQLYFAATGSGGTTVYNPSAAPTSVYSMLVGELDNVVNHPFETDTGWTVGDTGDNATTGIWNRADPVGTGAQPEDDHTPAPGVNCWVTDSRGGALGDYDVDGGKTTLKSPLFDLSAYQHATISYWRWYSNDTGATPHTDVFKVDISSNGGTSWVNAETVGPDGVETTAGWYYHEFDPADFVSMTSQIRLRFVAADLADGSLVEAAIDDFRIDVFSCSNQFQVGDLDCDGFINAFDIDPFVLALVNPDLYAIMYPDCDVMLADANGDGDVNAFDIDPFVELVIGG
jgi:hypothetical protein